MKPSALDSDTVSQSFKSFIVRGCKEGEEGNASCIELDPPLLTTNHHRYNTTMNDFGSVKIWMCLALVVIACVSGSLRFPLPSLPWLDRLLDATAHYLPVHDPRFSEVTTTLFENNMLSDQVQWDNYSLILRGQRVFLQ